MIQLTFLGVLVAFNPMLLVTELAIILKSKRTIINATAFALGIISPLIIIAMIGALVFNQDTQFSAFKHSVSLPPLLNIVIGAILLLIGLRLRFFPNSTRTKSAPSPDLSLGSLYLFACFRSALSFTSIVGIITATKIIKDYTDNYFLVLLGLLWTICVGMLPFFGLIGYSLKRPDSVEYLEERINPIVNRSYRPVVIWVCLVLGSCLISIGTLKLIRH